MLLMIDSDDKVIVAAAMIGESRMLMAGYSILVVMGMLVVL